MFPTETKQSMNIMGEGGGEEREVKVEDRTEGTVGGGCGGGVLGELQAPVTYRLRWGDKHAHVTKTGN